ncbi:MAG: tRNA uridine-5-carboxymethylaminomethyl(34) synthesis GTPase MnmE [Armatimonadetes bacterium]|nr:tRNA uridine-5-carboxymethylaminomethyl(34) synthesis GTPase MnmE [Armatimonadota bacterium]
MKNLYYEGVETFADTIVAPITGAGRAAVAILRLSGPRAWEIAGKVFSPWPEVVEPRHILYGHFINGDDGLVFPFEEGRSFTGEQVAELSVHGSAASVESLLKECLNAGARMAEPGEFSLRAFLNGEIDLTEAEGIRETVDAATSAQLRQANAFRNGKVREEIESIRDQVVSLLTAVEASTDFSEEIGDLDRDTARAKLKSALGHVDRLLSTADIGRRIRSGATVAIVGVPNAGKSSLLNALLREDRAIVTAIPGTTRDTIEATVELGGLPVRFVDTAGIRETQDEVERIGVDRSRQAIEAADLVIHLIDLSHPEEMEIDHDQVLRVGNKADLTPSVVFDGMCVSALTGEGLDALVAEIRARLGDAQTAEIPILDRHASLLEEARGAIAETMQTLDAPVPDDLAAVSLRSAARFLGEITGETTPPEVIDRIFHDFCIGK